MNKKRPGSAFQVWGKKINWSRRVKAVCKPCWEIKYCPYGPLVEYFPLKKVSDERSCRIFGHDCPVFHVAEPFTETAELRNIGRSIPRATQFRVLKRENQICSDCGRSVKDEDVEFDHIIPWSKGGSSDEHNIRLLCKACNKKRGNRFESEYLVESVRDHLVDPVGIEILDFLQVTAEVGHEYYQKKRRYPSARHYAKTLANGSLSIVERTAANVIVELDGFFKGQRPNETSQKIFKALTHRWGFIDREVHTLRESSKLSDISLEELFAAELDLISRLGWRVKLTATATQRWKRK
jgi:hypothetical protein